MKLKNTGSKPVFTETGRIMPGEVYTCDAAEGKILSASPHLEVVTAKKKKK
jgi:hypothetical protein